MVLEQLRKQLLVAMGLPLTVACWHAPAQTHRDTPIEPPRNRVATPTGPSAAQCKIDQVFETVCGSASTCGPTGAGLTDARTSGELYVTRHYDVEVFRGWALSPDATNTYRASLPDDAIKEAFCCYSACTTMQVAETAKQPLSGPDYHVRSRCIPAPPAGTSVPAPDNPACPGAVTFDGVAMPFGHRDNGKCCYRYSEYDPPRRHYKGRAARVDGTQRLADVARGAAWSGVLQPQLPASTDERARLAQQWLADARMEHASIAAFAKLALQLLAHGAPPELIARTHEAALDEIVHARICFALASAYAGSELAPAPFGDAAAMSGAGSLEELAIETLVDGCIGETAAALHAADEAARANDPVIAQVQQQISEDETRHAELAWAILAWCTRRGGPALQQRLRAELARLDRNDTLIAAVVAPCLGDLLAHVAS